MEAGNGQGLLGFGKGISTTSSRLSISRTSQAHFQTQIEMEIEFQASLGLLIEHIALHNRSTTALPDTDADEVRDKDPEAAVRESGAPLLVW